MRGTELLVPAVMASKLRRADEERLSKLAARPVERQVVKAPCPEPVQPDCLGTLKPINRPA